MNKCPLCDSQIQTNRSDFGRKIKIQCPKCGEYVTYDDAINYITDPNFGSERKKEFQVIIRKLNDISEKAEIIVLDREENKHIVARKVAE